MSTAQHSQAQSSAVPNQRAPLLDRSPWRRIADLVLRSEPGHCAIESAPLPASDLPLPEQLCFYLGRPSGSPLSPTLKKDDAVEAGMALAKSGEQRLLPSPFAGKVQAIRTRPDPRGSKGGPAILLRPDPDSDADVFDGLKIESCEADALRERITDAGVWIAGPKPRLLASELAQLGDHSLIVSTLDNEPGLRVAATLVDERAGDLPAALALLKKASGARRVVLACETRVALRIGPTCREVAGVEVVAVPSRYPDCHPALLRARLAPQGAVLVSLEAALAALDAVQHGRLQSHKLLTVMSADGEALANLRVPLGTPIAEVLRHLDIDPGQHDKVVVGGPMTGHAQQSLDAAIDAGMDGLVYIAAGRVPEWSDEPCINCGRCVEVCPMGLQIQLIGRYSEFGLFERTPDYKIERCIECGLCARHCIARRPLLQLVRLAQQQLALTTSAETGN